jgi:DNA polymerase elongation subunit (family B)
MTGQLSIRWIADKLNSYMNTALKTDNEDYVIASDTDSCYISMETLIESTQKDKTAKEKIEFMDMFCDKVLTPFISKSYQELADYLGSYEQRMIMKREVLADKGVFLKKKHYILRVHNSEGVQYEKPKYKIMGLEIVKSSTPALIRDKLKSSIDVIFDQTNPDLIKYIEEAKEDFKKIPVEDIASPRGVNNVIEYSGGNASIYKKGCPIHVRGALLFNFLIKELNLTDKYQPIKSGDKIKFIYLKMPNILKENVIAFPSKLPIEFGLHKYIDYDHQFEKTFLNAIEGIIDPIGWHLEEKSSLDAFFG